MDLHNWILEIHNWILEIHNWIMDHRNWIIDIHNYGLFMEIHNRYLWISIIRIMDLHN